MDLLSIKKSTDGKHKMIATFKNKETGRTKTTRFGAVGYTDYTLSKDEDKKKRYLARHKARENWNDPTSAGSLSKNILWNKTTIKASIADFKKQFNL
jgi:hypothetical protein|tara:strand:+ start:4302 stop:4592 length:291 start_codon:yes stop_codon:yes gene_type:complete